ncbi:MAG: secretin N-terminal domain-containing protein [Verrucomicrobiota bacterium]
MNNLALKRAKLVILFLGVGGFFMQPPLSAQQALDDVTLQFANAPLSFILLEYEKLTGKRIIRDMDVEGAELTIESGQSLSRSEAARFIEKNLMLNGFVLLPSGPDEVKIIAAQKEPRREGAPVIMGPEWLPEGDELVTYIMSLDFARAEDVLRVFQAIAPTHEYGEAVVLPDGNTLAITENSALIRKYLELKKHIDVPEAERLTRSFELERSDAESVVEDLNELLQAVGFSGASAAVATSGGERTESAGGGQPKVSLVPVTRTNRIIAVAHPMQMAYVEELVRELDSPAGSKNHISCALRYLSVLEFLPVAERALRRGLEEEEAEATEENSLSERNVATTNLGGEARETLAEPDDLGGPRTVITGRTLLIGDPGSNEFFATGPPEQLDLLRQLVEQLDQRPRQIYLATVIGQLSLGDDFDLGIDFLRTIDEFTVGGDPVSAAASYRTRGTRPLLEPGLLTDTAAFGAVPSGFTVYGQVGDFLRVYLDALEETSRFSVLSRPSVFTLNNEKAVIQTGQKVPVPVDTLTSITANVGNPAVASSIQYEDVVLRLEVIPLINSENEVTLQISQVNDDIIGTTIISGNEIPNISTQEMRTTVIVPNRSTVLLGGLISQDERTNQSGLPGMTRVPVLRHLTGSTAKELNRQELLIFIQPHIVNDDRDLAFAQEDSLSRSRMTPEALQFSTSEETPVMLPPRAESNTEEAAEERAREERKFRRQIWKSPLKNHPPREGKVHQTLSGEDVHFEEWPGYGGKEEPGSALRPVTGASPPAAASSQEIPAEKAKIGGHKPSVRKTIKR